MATQDALNLPLEIPWQLASTTQHLVAGEPDETTISLFTFQPKEENLTSEFPGQQLVFLKATVSISPAAFPPGVAPPAAAALGEGIPCYHVLLDMKVRKKSGELGTDRPYFHAAAPMRRQMLMTGVIGTDLFEGEASSQFIGKSGSEVHEATRSHTGTSSLSGGLSVLGVGLSGRTSTTDVNGSRDVTQVSDTTNRDASQERREMVSHMTKVENILTLLNAKYVGTPYLSFSLSPQPLQQLSADSSDPSLWFGQLLQRRSSGIEGVQDFTSVIMVPKGESFCVTARLRRICLLDDPPGPPNFDEPFRFTGTALGRLLVYLYDTYPIGTQLDQLDVDITQALTPPEQFARPAIESWTIGVAGSILADVISTGALKGQISRREVNYKTILELWLETLRDEYERDLVRSPLERGVLVGENRTLDTCFSFAEGGLLSLLNTSSSVSPFAPWPIRPGDLDIGGLHTTAIQVRTATKTRALETVTRWTALERQLATLLNNQRKPFPGKRGRLKDPRITGVLVERWSKMRQSDSLNLEFTAAMDMLKLGGEHRRVLKSVGVTDLKSLARALKAAPVIERYNTDLVRRQVTLKGAQAQKSAATASSAASIKFPLSPKLADAIREVIGDTLFGEGGEAPSPG
jgi:hypothetical protein